jgi:hypothetical protein
LLHIDTSSGKVSAQFTVVSLGETVLRTLAQCTLRRKVGGGAVIDDADLYALGPMDDGELVRNWVSYA